VVHHECPQPNTLLGFRAVEKKLGPHRLEIAPRSGIYAASHIWVNCPAFGAIAIADIEVANQSLLPAPVDASVFYVERTPERSGHPACPIPDPPVVERGCAWRPDECVPVVGRIRKLAEDLLRQSR